MLAGVSSAPDPPLERAGRHPGRQMLAAGAVGVALLVLFAPALAHAFVVWTSDQEFSFALLVPPITLGLLWLRRRALVEAVGRGATVGLVPLLLGLLLLLASTRSGIHALAGVAFLLTVLGITSYLIGVGAARVVAFPITFLTASLCLYRGLLNSLGFALQEMTARASADLAGVLGTPVQRSGVDLFAGR